MPVLPSNLRVLSVGISAPVRWPMTSASTSAHSMSNSCKRSQCPRPYGAKATALMLQPVRWSVCSCACHANVVHAASSTHSRGWHKQKCLKHEKPSKHKQGHKLSGRSTSWTPRGENGLRIALRGRKRPLCNACQSLQFWPATTDQVAPCSLLQQGSSIQGGQAWPEASCEVCHVLCIHGIVMQVDQLQAGPLGFRQVCNGSGVQSATVQHQLLQGRPAAALHFCHSR